MRRALLLLLVVAAVGAVMAYGALRRHGSGGTPAAKTTVHRVVQLRPPGPIPGYLLIADRGNNRMLLVDSAKRIYWRYPGSAGIAMPFNFDDDTFFGPRWDRIISNQEDQDTIQIITFPGRRIVWRYGHVNVKSGQPGYLNTPDDAYLLPNGLVTVADAYNCRVLFISHAHQIVRQYGTTGVCAHDPPRTLGAVNGATPLADGGTLVSEIAGSWIDDISRSGRLRWAVQAPVSYPSDPQLLSPNRILLADYSYPGAAIIINRSGRVLWSYRPTSGPGELNHPSLAMPLAPGYIAINDDYRDRVVIVSIRTHRIVWQYGHTDQPGTARGYLNTPDGMDLLPTAAAQASPVLRRLLAPHVPAKPKPPVATTGTTTGTTTTAAAPSAGVAVRIAYRLPAPVERTVAVAAGESVLIAGGLAADQSSTSGVFRLAPATGHLTALGSVPQAFHDGAGALLNGSLYVFGGGALTSSASVQRFDLATHQGSVVGSLPRPLSDLAAATVGGTVYLVGGWDGRTPRREIYATSDGVHFRVVGRLRQGVRYPAVAAVGSKLVIAGGTTAAGPVSSVEVFDTALDKVTAVGRLPQPVAGAAAVVLGGAVYVTGPRVVRIDPTTGQASVAGPPVTVQDAAGVSLGQTALLVGGSVAGRTTAEVRELRLR